MDFGQWVQHMRLERKMDMRAFSELVGIDISTISRIENGRTQVTLTKAVRMCEGLGVSLPMLLEILHGERMTDLPSSGTVEQDIMPRRNDIYLFLSYLHADWQMGYKLLADLLNTLASLHASSKRASSGRVRRFFVPEDVEKLLFDLPLYRFELHYPPDIEANDIWEVYQREGFLTLMDAGVYLKKVRQKMHVPLVHLQHAVKVSDSVLSRLEEGSLERVKLMDILTLDEQLEQHGKVIALYWKVCQDAEMVNRIFARSRHIQETLATTDPTASIEEQVHLISIFTTLCRWFQQSYPHEQTWMSELRKKLRQTPSAQQHVESTEEVSR